MIFSGILSAFQKMGAEMKSSDYRVKSLDAPLSRETKGFNVEKFRDLKNENVLQDLDKPLNKEIVSERKEIVINAVEKRKERQKRSYVVMKT